MAETASIQLHRARIPGHDRPTTLELRDGVIAEIGGAPEHRRANTAIDLDGRWVLPGLTDSHTHLLSASQQGLEHSLDHCRSAAEMLESLTVAGRSMRDGDWLIAATETLPADLIGGRFPTKEELGGVHPARPVVIRALGGHVALANDAALAQAAGALGSVPGDELAAGRLTEQHADALFGACPLPSDEAVAAALREEAEAYLRVGVTAVVEAAVGFTNGFDEEWAVWELIRRSVEPFPLRMGFMLRLDPEAALERDLAPGPIDLDWQVRTLKFFADGIVGARTAALHEDYADCPGHRGDPIYEPERLAELFAQSHAAGWQIAVHAIGDQAITDTLTAYAGCRDPERRHRIEHLGLPTADHIEAVRDLGLHVATQHGFMPLMGDMFETALGRDRAHQLFPTRTLLDRGVPLSGSSDFPIGPRSPLAGVGGATHRTTRSGTAFAPGECVAAAEALDSYLEAGAAISHQERLRGRVEQGLAADLAVFDEHPADMDPTSLPDTEAAMTIVRGQVAHSVL